jgi:hypothetical protein
MYYSTCLPPLCTAIFCSDRGREQYLQNIRVGNAQDVVDDDDEKSSANHQPIKQWGLDFSACIEGHYAVCHEEFEHGAGGSGINVYRIKKKHHVPLAEQTQVHGDYFEADQKMWPSKKGVKTYSDACLKGGWHAKKHIEKRVLGWQVIHVFKKLTKGTKIPSASKIIKRCKEHNLELFREPEQREFATALTFDVENSDQSDVDEQESSSDGGGSDSDQNADSSGVE